VHKRLHFVNGSFLACSLTGFLKPRDATRV